MDTTRAVKRTIAGALLSGGVALAGVVLVPGTAQATGGPFTWCPGQSMDWPTGPNMPHAVAQDYVWDMSVCHTWYRVPDGWGNVSRVALNGQQTLQSSNVWEGDNPPVTIRATSIAA